MWKTFALITTVLACATAHPPGPTPRSASSTDSPAKVLAPLWVGPAFSGAWYPPDRSGEGFVLQILENGTALALWFTYPPAGTAGQQAWMYADNGRIEGDRVRFTDVYTTRGPSFGPGFDPSRTQLVPWGTLEFRFTSCNDAEATYAGPAGWGSGTQRLIRLTAYAELECGGKRRLTASGARSIQGLKQRSGLWFDPTHNGEGWALEELPDGRTQVFWFTYDANGEQAWTIGVSPTSGDRMTVADNMRPVGTRFGTAFDPAQVVRASWGRVEIEFENCDRGTLRYESPQPGFGNGVLRPVRLSRLAGIACLDTAPAVPANGAWAFGATMPQAQSEMAAASLGGMSYLAGGFGDPLGFKRYDPAANTWTTLAGVPGGRDHAIAVAIGGDIYVTGGYAQGGGDQQGPGWRYGIAANRWEAIPELPYVAASGGAALGGFAYFGTISGAVIQFNPRTRASRVIGGDGHPFRDHSQLVAFQGELWLIGGRGPGVETNRVSIFDPASETWRTGPPLGAARAGFAAAASESLVIVAGGELLSGGPFRTLSSVEAIAAGANAWTSLAPLPTAVHGTVGAIHGNAFHVLAGSTVAGGVGNRGDVQTYRWGP